MKLEVKFEEQLWFQFCLTTKDKLPVSVVFEILKVFYLKTSDQVLQHKVREL